MESELAIPIENRMPFNICWKQYREEYDRLVEISPIIPHRIMKAFRKIHGRMPNFNVPSVVGRMRHTFVYQNTTTVLNDIPKPPPPPSTMIDTDEAIGIRSTPVEVPDEQWITIEEEMRERARTSTALVT